MQCDHSLESYWTVLSCGAVCFVIQCGSNFLVCGSNHAVWPFFGKLLNNTFMWCCLVCDTVREKLAAVILCGASCEWALHFLNWRNCENEVSNSRKSVAQLYRISFSLFVLKNGACFRIGFITTNRIMIVILYYRPTRVIWGSFIPATEIRKTVKYNQYTNRLDHLWRKTQKMTLQINTSKLNFCGVSENMDLFYVRLTFFVSM